MDHFRYRKDRLYAEDIALSELAKRYGTPCYIYSRATLERHWHAFDQALGKHPHLICYAVKANANIGVLNVLARLGSGFDIVSIGELERVLMAGGVPAKIVFSGIGKREDELQRALEVGIHCFNVESSEELDRLNKVAKQLGKQAPVSLRINPDVDAATHPYIATGLKENKFGIDITEVLQEYQHAQQLSHIEVIGVDCHIGSQLTELGPFRDALERVLALVQELKVHGIAIHHLDMGGGLGICYHKESPPEPGEYAAVLLQRLQDTTYHILLEPGRAIAGNAGILLTRVEYLKPTPYKNFAIVDAAMNDLVRPALYQAWQEILRVEPPANDPVRRYDVVGPVCESGDFLGKDRLLSLRQGDLLAIRSAGAYGFSMSSQYNARPRAAEVMVDGANAHLVRARETLAQLWLGESSLPDDG